MQNRKIIISIPVILMLMNVSIFGQSTDKLILYGLSVEGNDHTDTGLITATSGLVTGDPLTGELVQSAIRQLWELNLFSDIKIIAEKQEGAGVYLLIRVVEFPRLEFIDIGGGKKIKEDEIEESIELNKGQVLRPTDAVKIRRKLRRLYDDKGYLLADITVLINDGSVDGLASLYIRINEGKKVRIKKIEFNGNEAFSDKKLRKQFKETKQKWWIFRSGKFERSKFDADLELMLSFYRDNGYRDAVVVSDSIWYSDDLKRMYMNVTVDEGNLLYFGKVTFSGSDLFSEEVLRLQMMFRSGDVFSQKKYDQSIHERLSTKFYDQGYIYAQIQTALIPAGGDTLNVEINIVPGNKFSVRKINIIGNTKTREKVIRREFVLKPGDTFDVTKLRRSIREVAILNYFADVKPDLEDVSENEVDLWVSVEEKPTDQANISTGYSEQDGLIGSIGLSAPNLFGTGQQASFDWSFGTSYNSFSVSYTEPWFRDTETLVGASFYHLRRHWSQGFTERSIGGSVRLGRRLVWPDDYFRGDWIYQLARSKNDDIDSSMSHIDSTVRISSSITQIFTRDSRDFVEFPSRGSVFSLSSKLAGGPLLGSDEYHKHIFSVDWYSPIFPKLIIYNHFQYGFMSSLSGDSLDIPYSDKFFMGGSGLAYGTPLRGYNEQTVGPIGSNNNIVGGRSQMKLSVELRLQMVNNPTIYGLLFTEAGKTWLDINRTDPFDLNRSVGFGIRLFMPMVGMIGLD
ncbi:MAG: outer membrane protein assembly factor BamA, partial [Calditrichaeota bacterium]|nr:outer membrane protein assembly factor BamA [Calditrichota bacterium]